MSERANPNEYICVFGSSSARLKKEQYDFAYELGAAIAGADVGIVFGAGRCGLMGSVADGAISKGGRIVGVIPERLNMPGIAHPGCDELVVTKDMRARKAEMDRRCSSFIALPGGFGTLEELLEVITLKQLGYHDKPVVICNPCDFYDCLLAQLEIAYKEGFTDEAFRVIYQVASTPDEALRCALLRESIQVPDKMGDWDKSHG